MKLRVKPRQIFAIAMFLRSAYDYYGWGKSYYQPDHNPNITVNNESACSEVLSYDDWADRLENIQSLFRLTKSLFSGAISLSIMKIVWMLMVLSIMFH